MEEYDGKPKAEADEILSKSFAQAAR